MQIPEDLRRPGKHTCDACLIEKLKKRREASKKLSWRFDSAQDRRSPGLGEKCAKKAAVVNRILSGKQVVNEPTKPTKTILRKHS